MHFRCIIRRVVGDDSRGAPSGGPTRVIRSAVADEWWCIEPRYRRRMAWSTESLMHRDPMLQLGWELVGAMVRRRREWLGWSQRDLARQSGTSQSGISRLETGRLRGLKFHRFAAIVAVLGGLDREAPAPPYRSVQPEVLEPIRLDYGPPDSALRQWLPNRDGGSYTSKDPRGAIYAAAMEARSKRPVTR